MTDVQLGFIARFPESVANLTCDAVLLLTGALGIGACESQLSARGVFQKRAQCRYALGAGFGQVDLLGRDGAEHLHLASCARYGDVQTPPAALAVERTEVHIDLAVLVGAVADREQDYVALVALHILEILDENRLLRVVEPLFQALVGSARIGQHIVDQVLLGDVEGHDADALFVKLAVLIAALDLLNDRLRLLSVAAVGAALEYAVHMHQIDLAFAVVDRREGVKLILIEVAVAECDQALVAAPVVPEQMRLRHVERKAVVENALQILHIEVVLVDGIRGKERGWRHLLGIADDDGVLTSREHAHRLAGRQL